MKARHIPNILTSSRFFLTIAFIIISVIDIIRLDVWQFTIWAFIPFAIAGCTDMLDGPLARRIKGAKTEFGAELDTMADMFLLISAIFILIPRMHIWPETVIGIYTVLTLKVLGIVPAIIKHKKPFLTHSIMNKALAVMLFLGAIAYFFVSRMENRELALSIMSWYLVAMIVLVVILVIDEMATIWLLDYPEKNAKSVFHVKKLNEEYHASKNSVSKK